MRYEVMLFISEKQLAAIDISEEGTVDQVSLEGNSVIAYSDEPDIEQFCECVKEYYNIGDFTEIDICVSIIIFNAAKKMVQFLYDQISESAGVNIVDAKHIVPLLLLKECTIQKNTKYFVSVFDVDYAVDVSENLKMKCSVIEELQVDRIMLDIEKFVFFSKFDGNKLVFDEAKMQRILEEEKEKAECKYDLLMIKYQKSQRESEKLKMRMKDLQKKYDDMMDVKKSSRIIHTFSEEEGKEFNQSLSLFNLVSYLCRYKITCNFMEGVQVEKGDKIASVELFYEPTSGGRRLSSSKKAIKAQSTGRIFYLVHDGAEIKNGTDIAIIAHESDTQEEVMNWYHKTKKSIN